MRLLVVTGWAVGAFAALVLSAGCAGGGSGQTMPLPNGVPGATQQFSNVRMVGAQIESGSVARSRTALLPIVNTNAPPYNDRQLAARHAEVAISETVYGIVHIYLANPPHTEVGQLTGFNEPQGLAVDAKNNLYVANTKAHDILVFAPGASVPFLTLDDAGNLPVGVAVDVDGTVYVANIQAHNGPAGIVVYPEGATKPAKTLTDPSISADYFVAVGPNHHIYTTYFDQSGVAQVGEYLDAKPPLHNLNIANYQFAGGIQISDGNVLIDDQNARALLFYLPPHRYPRSFIPLIGTGDPITFNYNEGDGTAWVADGNGAALRYDSSGKQIDSIDVGGVPIGIAILPRR